MAPIPGTPRPWRARLAASLGAAAMAGVASAATAPAASAYATSSVTLAGHGWGHGRGMGQWGALGYALQGQAYSWILGHYYSNTSPGTVPTSQAIRVRMVENDGNDVIVTSASAFTAAGVAVPAGHAALMHLSAPGTWQVSTAPGCGGPWTQAATVSDTGSGPQPVAVPASTDPAAPTSQLLQLCMVSGNETLRGSLSGAEVSGVERTVDTLPLESYLRGVVPSESPSYWGGLGGAGAQGQPQGFQALEAQAVAARSYAMADLQSNGGQGAYGYADICDSTACQVYRGVAAENSRSDLAVADTAGQVLVMSDGSVARTEFSSSTGGWTAGGTFPAVVDSGDSVCVQSACNPNHDWNTTVPVSAIQSAFPSIGTLEAVNVTARSGPSTAADGGRVEQMQLQGSSGSVSVSGASFAGDFGLKSDWFSVIGTPSGGVDGYWIGASDGGMFSFGNANFYGSTGNLKLNKPVVGMAATPDGAGYWLVASDGGIFTFGDARFFGSTGAIRLNKPIVGMAPTADGAGYWLVASDGGMFNFGDARFYGSTGGRSIPAPVEGMAATPDGAGYWLTGSDGSVYPFGDAASLGSLSDIGASDTVVGMAPTATGKGYLLVGETGNVYSFGDAPSFGGVPDQVPGYSGQVLDLAPHLTHSG
ncbi:MAG TPA: SpoIID/LytB domain-containing protein [Acidimicrobiales bacterium]|nr:SpoIID/LytB domain-containing protein [Acidimicrobiales bacterium]